MGRNRTAEAFEPDETAVQPESQAPAEVVSGSAMTVYGMTVDAIIEGSRQKAVEMQSSIDEKAAAILAKDAKIAELVEYGKSKNVALQELTAADAAKAAQIAELGPKVDSLTKDLGMARMTAKATAGTSRGIERLPGGGIRLAVTLDEDSATPFLSQAECAGEDPAVFIQRQLEEALLAFAAS